MEGRVGGAGGGSGVGDAGGGECGQVVLVVVYGSGGADGGEWGQVIEIFLLYVDGCSLLKNVPFLYFFFLF